MRLDDCQAGYKVAAKQIMIDAMVIEINSSDLQSYGVELADTSASADIDIVTKIISYVIEEAKKTFLKDFVELLQNIDSITSLD